MDALSFDEQYKRIQFKGTDRIAWLKTLWHPKKQDKREYMNEMQMIFYKGEQKFKEEFNVFEVFKTL